MTRKLKLQYLATAILVFLLFLGIAIYVPQLLFDEVPLLFYLIETVLLFFAMTGINRLFVSKGIGELNALMEIFEQDCNPHLFVERAETWARSFKQPYSPTAIWFLSYYARGLAEAGRIREGAQLFDSLRKGLTRFDRRPDILAAMYVNLAPVIRIYLGGKYALQALTQADKMLEDAGFEDDTLRGRYAQWERSCLEAQRDGNLARYVRLMREMSDDASCSWLIRVECAERESWAYRAIGNYEAERERLRFVLEHGGTLSCISRAHARLAE